jgi:hypothetical protein
LLVIYTRDSANSVVRTPIDGSLRADIERR